MTGEMPKKIRVPMPWTKKEGKRLLWGREFKVTKQGLDEEQVVSFVNDLIAQYSASLGPLLETTVADAEQLAANIKMKTQKEAEAEAERIISQAKQEVQDIKRNAEIAAEKEAQDTISSAKRKAEIIEVEAKQRALIYLLKAREGIDKEVGEEYKRAYSRLFFSLQDLMSEGKNIELELKSKRAALLEGKSFELKEYEAVLPSTSGVTVSPFEDPVPTETEVELGAAVEDKIEQPVQLEEEAERKAEEARKAKEAEKRVKEEAKLAAKEEARKVKEAEKRAKEEAKLAAKEEARKVKEAEKQAKEEAKLAAKEEAVEDKIEQPVQLEEEAVEDKIEQPVQLEDEAVTPGPVGPTAEGVLEQQLSEEEPITEEAKSAQVKPDSQSLYVGEVELLIASPVELKLVSKLYNYLQTVPELRILYTRGSWDQGTTIIVVLDKPTPFVNIISGVPGIKVTPELLEKGSLVRGKSNSLLRGGEKGGNRVDRIKLTLKES